MNREGETPGEDLKDAKPFVELTHARGRENADDNDEMTLEAQNADINNDKLDVELHPLMVGEQEIEN